MIARKRQEAREAARVAKKEARLAKKAEFRKNGCLSCEQKKLNRRLERERLNIKTGDVPCKECPPEK